MLTAPASVAFEEGHSDAINGNDPWFPEDSAYMAGWQVGRVELIGREAFEEQQEQDG